MANFVTYSGKDLNGSVNNLYAPGGIQFSGIAESGVAQVTVRMTQTQSSLQVGMDGAVVPSVIPGDQGEIEISVWQTSTLHQEFLALYNALKTQRDLGDVSQWFGTTILIQNIVDGSSHLGTGCGFSKVPDKTYTEQAQRVNWTFMCSTIINQ